MNHQLNVLTRNYVFKYSTGYLAYVVPADPFLDNLIQAYTYSHCNNVHEILLERPAMPGCYAMPLSRVNPTGLTPFIRRISV